MNDPLTDLTPFNYYSLGLKETLYFSYGPFILNNIRKELEK